MLVTFFVLVMVLILFVLWPIFNHLKSKSEVINTSVSSEAKPAESTTATSNESDQTQKMPVVADSSLVKNAIDKVVSAHSELVFGVSFIDLNDNSTVSVGGDRLFLAASTAKVLAAIYFLDQVQKGIYTIDMKLGDNTARYHLEQMIRQSNNTSWDLFNALLGFSTQRAYAKKNGLVFVIENNSMTSDGMAVLLAKLYNCELLNNTNTQLLLSLMHNTHDERYIPGSDVDAVFYHKTGKFEHVVHDAAIIDNGTNKYVLVIYTEGTGSAEGRIPVFHEIAESVNKVVISGR